MQPLIISLVIALLFAIPKMDSANNPPDPLNLDARSLSQMLKSGEISAEQVMTATLDRIDDLNPKYNAIIALRDRSTLLEEARQCDRELQKYQQQSSSNNNDNDNNDNIGRRRLLCGIPIAIKDMANVVGLPTTKGGSMLHYYNNYPSVSDPFVQRMVEDEGAIVIGKTNTPELGVGSHTFNTRWGTTVNPYDTSKSAGGSSGGAAVAIATRMLCLADGSDMMGSLRNPAGWNGIYSHRPTAGMMDEDDSSVNPLPYPITTPGPMARNPMDVAFLLDIMAGNDKFDCEKVPEIPNVDGMKIAWLGNLNLLPVEDGILPLCKQALTSFSSSHGGVAVTDMRETPFDVGELWKSWTTIRSKIISGNFDYVPKQWLRLFLLVAPIREELKWEVRRGLDITEEQCREAADIAMAWSMKLETLFSEYDALALPTSQVWPFPKERKWPKEIAGKEMDTYHRWMEITVPGSLAGLPCTTIPAGVGENGLPIGIQLLGARGEDAKLLKLAQAYCNAINLPGDNTPVA